MASCLRGKTKVLALDKIMVSDPCYFSTLIYHMLFFTLCYPGFLACPLNMPTIFSPQALGICWYLCPECFSSRYPLETFPLAHQISPYQRGFPWPPYIQISPTSQHAIPLSLLAFAQTISTVHLPPPPEDKPHENRDYILFNAAFQHLEQCLKFR